MVEVKKVATLGRITGSMYLLLKSTLLHKAGLVPSSSRPDVFETTVEDSVCNNIAQLSYFMVKR